MDDIKSKFLTQRVVRLWHKLPREALDAPSLELFKPKPKPWAAQSKGGDSPAHSSGLELHIFKVPSSSCSSVILWTAISLQDSFVMDDLPKSPRCSQEYIEKKEIVKYSLTSTACIQQ